MGVLGSAEPARQGMAGLVRPYHHRFPAVFALGEHRVGAGEVDDGQGIGVRHVGSRRPFGNQDRGPDVVVVVAQETGVHIELLDELRENLFTHLGRSGCRSLHQPRGDGGDDEVQAARQGVLRYGEHVPFWAPGPIRGGCLQGCLSRCTPMRTGEPHRSRGLSGRPGAGHEIRTRISDANRISCDPAAARLDFSDRGGPRRPACRVIGAFSDNSCACWSTRPVTLARWTPCRRLRRACDRRPQIPLTPAGECTIGDSNARRTRDKTWLARRQRSAVHAAPCVLAEEAVRQLTIAEWIVTPGRPAVSQGHTPRTGDTHDRAERPKNSCRRRRRRIRRNTGRQSSAPASRHRHHPGEPAPGLRRANPVAPVGRRHAAPPPSTTARCSATASGWSSTAPTASTPPTGGCC